MESKPLNLKKATIRGTVWNYASFYSGKVLMFVSTLVLARVLLQEDFGVAGYALVMIRFLDTVDDMGVGPALIYHKDDPDAPNTAFWLGLGISLVLYLLAWLIIAPIGGMIFHDQRAVDLTRVLALVFPINALRNIHSTLLQKKLAFGRKFIPDFAQSAAKGGLSIVLALMGFGAWSLILGQVGGAVISVFVYWWSVPWRPTLSIKRELVKPLLSYGVGSVVVDTVAVLVSDIDYVFIGHFLTAVALGVYTLAFRIPELIILQFCRVLSSVIFPVYVRMRDDPTALSRGYVATTRYVALATVPIGLGLAVLSKPFILTAFTAKWADAIPAMQGIAIYAMLLSMTYHAGVIYKSRGEQSLLTGLILLRVAILVPGLWWAVTTTNSIVAVAWVQAAAALIGGAVNMLVAAKKTNTSYAAIFDALRPALFSGLLMALAVQGSLSITDSLPPAVQLIVGVLVGAAVYTAGLWWLQRDIVLKTGQIVRSALARG